MQFYKKPKETNNNNEYLKMTSSIKSDPINNVCFECGCQEPQYISINNAVFVCKDCIVNHLSFSPEISQIIINDLYTLNLTEVKTLFLGGNRKLIQFINFDYPGLKQFPPEKLYKTLAVDYYRKNLKFLVNGGKRPLKPNNQLAYQLLENFGNFCFLSPRIGKSEKYFNSTELTPILEGKDEFDEKENNEDDKIIIEINNNFNNFKDCKEKKEDNDKKIDVDNNNTKNESTLANTPHKNMNENINKTNKIFNKSIDNEKNADDNINNIINKYYNKNSENENKNKNDGQEKEEVNNNLNINEEIKFNIDKNLSEIIKNEDNSSNFNLKSSEINNNSNNNLNEEISGDDNTIKIVNGYINDFTDIKSNKENNDTSNSLIKEEKNEVKIIKLNIKNNNKNKNDNYIEKRDNKVKRRTCLRKNEKNEIDNDFENDIDDIRSCKKIIKKENSDKKYKKENKDCENEDNNDINLLKFYIVIKVVFVKIIKNINYDDNSLFLINPNFSMNS